MDTEGWQDHGLPAVYGHKAGGGGGGIVATWFALWNNFKLPWGISMDLTYGRYSDWIWRGSIRVRGNQYLDFGFRKDFLDKRLQVRLTGADILRTNSDYFYRGDYGGIGIDGVRTFDNRRFGAGATWEFGNQKAKAAKRSRGAMEEKMRRLNGGINGSTAQS